MSSQSLNVGLEILSDSAYVSPQSENTPLWPVIGEVKAVNASTLTVSFFSAPDGGAHTANLPFANNGGYLIGDMVTVVFRGTNPESGIIVGKMGDGISATWLLSLLLTIDGGGSDIDADTVDEYHAEQLVKIGAVPASAAAAGNTDEIAWDSNYFYICVASNTWRRIAHATW